MPLDIDVWLEGATVHISTGDDWTLTRPSDAVGEIRCEDEYVFVEDTRAGCYRAYAPAAAADAVLESSGETVAAAREKLEATVRSHQSTSAGINYGISGTLAFETPDTDCD